MNTPLGPLFAFLSSVTWAIGSAQYSKYTNTYSAFRLNFTRAYIALPCFILAVFISSGGIQGGLDAYGTLRSDHLTWFFVSIVSSYALGDAFFLWSTLSLGIPGSLAIASCYPILNALYAWLFDGANLGFLQWSGLLISIFGIVIVILNQPIRESPPPSRVAHDENEKDAPTFIQKVSRNTSLGILFATLTAFSWSINSIAVATAARDLDPGVGNTVRMFFALILCVVFGKLIAKENVKPLPVSVLKSLGPIIFLESFAGCYFFVYGLSRSNLVLASILTSLAPVISVPVTVMLGMEKFSWKRTLGVVTVVVGLALLSTSI